VNRTVRILVAEDNEDHRFLITRALQGIEGIDLLVEAVRDGAEALDYLYQRGGYEDRPRPHLILLDLKMPKVQGLEVLDVLKNDPSLRSIPIAVLTSSDRQQDIDASYQAGTNAYLQKRPMFGDLREKLQAMGEFWTNVALLPEPPA
jgi:two-component system, chemotaxis family, response regulator Rcp1